MTILFEFSALLTKEIQQYLKVTAKANHMWIVGLLMEKKDFAIKWTEQIFRGMYKMVQTRNLCNQPRLLMISPNNCLNSLVGYC